VDISQQLSIEKSMETWTFDVVGCCWFGDEIYTHNWVVDQALSDTYDH
jgi:hypothetical protein